MLNCAELSRSFIILSAPRSYKVPLAANTSDKSATGSNHPENKRGCPIENKLIGKKPVSSLSHEDFEILDSVETKRMQIPIISSVLSSQPEAAFPGFQGNSATGSRSQLKICRSMSLRND